MRINRSEIYFYLLVFFSVLLGSSYHVLTYDKPNTTPPTEPNTATQITPTPTEVTTAYREPNNSLFVILRLLITVIAVAAILFGLYQLIRVYNSQALQKRLGTDKIARTQKEKIGKLKDARETAYKIIEEGLISGEYTSAFIEAYHALDTSLNYFREISRPPYWTPKEYSFNVRDPVFKPSVYRFVSVFYDLRYGMLHAEKDDLLAFKLALDYLFIKDVPKQISEQWSTEFGRYVSQYSNYKIPSRANLTQPKRR